MRECTCARAHCAQKQKRTRAASCSYVKADSGGKKSSTGGNLLQTIAHILGVNDISQINPDANLGDLGLDSLMGVEIKQALERDYDITLSMKEIRTLTLNKLQRMAESGGQSSTALQTNTELDMKKESEREAKENSVEVLEAQMSQVCACNSRHTAQKKCFERQMRRLKTFFELKF